MTNLYLIRHGEATTQMGVSLRDEGLTPLGVRQAERLRDRLQESGEIVPDIFIASTLPRARQTAQIIAPAFDNMPIIYDEEVRELYPGVADQMTVAEFRERYGGYRLDEDPFQPVSPGGETWGQFMLRASTALNRIVTEHEGKTIVVVCHGGIIDASFVYFLCMDSLTIPPTRFDTRNTSITHWGRWTNNPKRPPRWWLTRYNDDIHVRGLDTNTTIPWQAMPTPPYKEWSKGRWQPTKPPTEM